jgi:hypothetical protein
MRIAKMSMVNAIEDVTKGVLAGITLLTALPVFGVAGTITAAGIALGATLGATAVVIDKMNE